MVHFLNDCFEKDAKSGFCVPGLLGTICRWTGVLTFRTKNTTTRVRARVGKCKLVPSCLHSGSRYPKIDSLEIVTWSFYEWLEKGKGKRQDSRTGVRSLFKALKAGSGLKHSLGVVCFQAFLCHFRQRQKFFFMDYLYIYYYFWLAHYSRHAIRLGIKLLLLI